jgi:hypothetical protein
MAVRRFWRIAFLMLMAFLTLAAPGRVVDSAFAEGSKKEAPVGNPKTPDDLDLIDVGTVKEIKQFDIVTLDNGKTYHLDEIRVPVLYGVHAINYLKAAALGRKVGIYAIKSSKTSATDRYGYLYGHLMRDDGTWIQADMVARGLAWAFSTETNHSLVIPLYKYEAVARAEKLGFWKDPEYDIKTKANIAKYMNSYQIFQGVLTLGGGGADRYVFGCDSGWSTPPSFTFGIRYEKSMFFRRGSASPGDVFRTWTGAVVRVRGWVEKDADGHPSIEVTHPQQMEFINPETGEPTTVYE